MNRKQFDPLGIVRIADKAGLMDIMLHTNGNLLTHDITDQLLGSGLTAIYFSIDAIDPETYSRVRPGGDFSRVMENIAYSAIINPKQRRYHLLLQLV